jgi:putative hydrolase of the HAD superfamily
MKDLSNVKAILFDLDNTLMDFRKMKDSAIESAAEAMIDAGLPLSKGEAIRKINAVYKRFGIEYQFPFNQLLKEEMGRVDYKVLAAGVVAYRKVKEIYVSPYPNVVPTLIELIHRGYKLGMISDAPTFQAWTRLAGMALHHYFDFVVSLDDTGTRKPSGLPFQAAIKKLELQPEELLMVGDNPGRDIAGANRLGIPTVLAAYGCLVDIKYLKGEEEADFVIKDIKELLDILPKRI